MERKQTIEENIPIENKNLKESINTAEEYKKSKDLIPKKLKFTFKEANEYETIEETIEKIEHEITKIDEEIPKVATDFIKLKELTDKREKAEEKLEEKMDRYVYLEELAEKIVEQEK